MNVEKRYLTVIDHNPWKTGHHEEKGSYRDMGDAVYHANQLATRGAESVLVISKAGVFDSANAWVSHFKDAWMMH